MPERPTPRPEPINLQQVRTIPLTVRSNKVSTAGFARPAQVGQSAKSFLDSLPRILAGNDFRAVVSAVVNARRNNRPVILGFGAHVIKCGLSPLLIDLMRRGIITALATNGSGAIHDFELALIGETSEDVAAGLKDGTFGMVRETGELMHEAINRSMTDTQAGLGQLLGRFLDEKEAPNRDYSLSVAAARLGLPFTVHVALGTDIIHMHPQADGAALGRASFNDFRLFCGAVAELTGGVYLNVGSAVIMPEVFLKAFTVAQNLGANLHDYTTVNMDMIAHYRSGENVVRRPAGVAGQGFTIIGRHEFLLPMLAQAVCEELESADATANHNGASKRPEWPELLAVRQAAKLAGRTVVWTNGTFDLLHPGHLSSLQAAKRLGDLLVVGVNSDRSVKAYKGPSRPILNQDERASMLAALDCVDHVIIFAEDTPAEALSRLQPDIHCKGAEYAPPNGRPVPERAVVERYGGRIEYLPLLPGLSTSDLLGRIRQAE